MYLGYIVMGLVVVAGLGWGWHTWVVRSDRSTRTTVGRSVGAAAVVGVGVSGIVNSPGLFLFTFLAAITAGVAGLVATGVQERHDRRARISLATELGMDPGEAKRLNRSRSLGVFWVLLLVIAAALGWTLVIFLASLAAPGLVEKPTTRLPFLGPDRSPWWMLGYYLLAAVAVIAIFNTATGGLLTAAVRWLWEKVHRVAQRGRKEP